MKIKTATLKKALDAVKPALANKEIIEQTTSFAFVDGNVLAYNDEISITAPIEDIGFTGVIKADELYKYVSKLKEETIDLTITDTEIQMKAGRSKSGFALTTEILLPLNEEISEKGKWKKLPENFATACKFAAASASTDMSDQKLTCVHFDKKGVIEASNNHRLVIWYFKKDFPFDSTLIPATSIKEVVRLQPTQISEGNGWIHLKNEQGIILSCRIVAEQYMDVRGIVKQIGRTKPITFPDELLPVLAKAEIFGNEQKTDGSVTLTFSEGKIMVTSESLTAWFKEPVAYDGYEEFSFSITPYLLTDILKETKEGAINKNMLVFKNENWMYVTSLRTYEENEE